jgi:hypothetical protein
VRVFIPTAGRKGPHLPTEKQNFCDMKKWMMALALTVAAVAVWAQKTEEVRRVDSFDKLSVGGSYDVFVAQGNEESVKLVGDADLIAEIVTEVAGGTLKIHKKRSKGWNWDNGKRLTIYVTFKQLTAITNSGSNNVVVTTKIKAESFAVSNSGSGDLEMSLDAERLTLSISGSSDVKLSGMVGSQEIAISGSGDVEALELQSRTASVSISGSGNVALWVSDELDGRVSGSGDIRYRGTPRQQVKISGSGSLSQVN